MIIAKMRSAMGSLLAALVVGLSLGTVAVAQEAVLELDPAQTQIHFTVGSTLHTVHGTFKLKHGTVRFDSATGKMSGAVVIDVASGETGDEGRDRKMHNSVLQSQQYSEATFSPSQMTGKLDSSGTSEIEVRGVFNLHGADHDLTLVFHVERAGDRLAASTHFVIPYVEWGMKSPSTFLLKVKDKVDVEINAVGRLANGSG